MCLQIGSKAVLAIYKIVLYLLIKTQLFSNMLDMLLLIWREQVRMAETFLIQVDF